ncbi:MAG: aminopeptidase [Clostridiales bacterium]|jgi:aminopeptidase|nr:aminopeptidase [Clostridiales bacterium]
MTDQRVTKLAYNLVNFSIKVKKGEKVLIEASDVDFVLVNALIKQVYEVGGLPFVHLQNNRVQREILLGISQQYADKLTEYFRPRMQDMDCYIAVRGAENAFETSDVPNEKTEIYNKFFHHPVHNEVRVKKTRWCVLRYPTPSFAQLMGTSTDAFEDYYFDVCNLDYSKMDKAMDGLVQLLDKTDKVQIKGPGTDLTFSIKDIPANKCSGEHNIPDGEVYTAPVKNSINGVISYNTPSIREGFQFENIVLKFKDGKIVDASANDSQKINKIFDTDQGARFVGEFSLGVNPYITKGCGELLFDEKISGSIHLTPGQCYNEAYNGNQSAIHWDLVLVQTKEQGGGEIYFDDILVRKDGIFVIKQLECLNVQNLK